MHKAYAQHQSEQKLVPKAADQNAIHFRAEKKMQTPQTPSRFEQIVRVGLRLSAQEHSHRDHRCDAPTFSALSTGDEATPHTVIMNREWTQLGAQAVTQTGTQNATLPTGSNKPASNSEKPFHESVLEVLFCRCCENCCDFL